MALEVRQLIIKSVVAGSVVAGSSDDENGAASRRDVERLKEEILSECRDLVNDLMRAERER